MNNKKHYYNHNILNEIDTAIDLICDERGFCTPTDVLRLCGLFECNEMRSVVVSCASRRNLFIVPSGKGFRIAVE